MNVGFIGAGKAGSALGRYFAEHKIYVVGYYDCDHSAAQFAASQTESTCFNTQFELANASDLIFITVPDGIIAKVWDELRRADSAREMLGEKIICHCSGCMTSAVFDGADEVGVHRCSAHPLLAFSDPACALDDLARAHITLEGDETAVHAVGELFKQLGNPIHLIEAADKVRYHAAAVFASNLVLAPLDTAAKLMETCGFTADAARDALQPLIEGNVHSFCEKGARNALTGPVERNDISTVENHLAALDNGEAQLYRALTKSLINLAKEKHPDRDYSALYSLVGKVQA